MWSETCVGLKTLRKVVRDLCGFEDFEKRGQRAKESEIRTI